jgi:hypothetical protein
MWVRSSLFWDITQCRLVILYRRFGTTYRSHLQGTEVQEESLPTFRSNLSVPSSKDKKSKKKAFRRFEAIYRSHLRRTRSPRRKPSDVLKQFIGPIFEGQKVQEESLPTFRSNLSVPSWKDKKSKKKAFRRFESIYRSHLRRTRSPRRKPSDVSGQHIRPIFRGQEVQKKGLRAISLDFLTPEDTTSKLP